MTSIAASPFGGGGGNPFRSGMSRRPMRSARGGGGNPFVTLKKTARDVKYEFDRPAGEITYDIDMTKNPLTGTFGDAGEVTRSVGPVGGIIKHGIDDAGQIRDGYGFRDDRGNIIAADQGRDRVEGELMRRLNIQADRNRGNLETRLVNRGLRPGSAEYERAMAEFERGYNDRAGTAILSAGQEHSRLAGLARDEAIFGRQSQAQRFGQNQARSIIGNHARVQAFNEALSRAGLANQAQGQLYGQLLNRAEFGNRAQGQEFGQNQARSILRNSANAQDFGQHLGRADFFNRAQQQNHQQDLDRFNAELASRNQALGEASQLTGLLQQIAGGAPGGLGRSGSVPTIDYAGLTQANYANQVNAANQRNRLAGSIIGASTGLF